MDMPNVRLALRNPCRREVPTVYVDAFADADAVHLCIPQAIQAALELEAVEERSVVQVDGGRQSVAYAGPIEVRFAGRVGFTGALVMGDQAVLGVVPMEDMDLLVAPRRVTLRPRGKDWTGYFASKTRASLPERVQPPLEERESLG